MQCAATQYLPRIMIRNLDATRPIRSTLGSTRSDWNEGRIRPFYMGSVQPTLTQVVDNHTLKYGYDFRVVRENFSTDAYKGGQFFFDGTFTAPASNSSSTLRNVFGRDALRSCSAFRQRVREATPARSIIRSTTRSNRSITESSSRTIGASRKADAQLGLRYDLEQGLTERFNRILRGFDLGTPSPIEAQVRAAYTTAFNANPANFVVTPANFHVLGGYTFADENNRNVWEADRSNFQPRIGASYQLTEKRSFARASEFSWRLPDRNAATGRIRGHDAVRSFKQQRTDVRRDVDESIPERIEWVQPSFGSSLVC